MQESQEIFLSKTKPSLMLATNVGNMYTPSLYGSLISYVTDAPTPSDLAGRRAGCFSYGSGLVASFYSLSFSGDASAGSPLAKLRQSLGDVRDRMEARTKVSPPDFAAAMQLREDTHHAAPYQPSTDPSGLFPGTYYLASVDDKHRRSYKKVPDTPEPMQMNGH